MNRLQDKVVVVTGASSGIGESIVRIFAAEGAKVYMIARREERLKKIADEVKAAGGTAIPFAGTVDSQENVTALFDLVIKDCGKVDVVVNNAGIGGKDGTACVTDEECYRLFETNAMGTMRMVREALKYMVPAGKGTFVAIGSVGGLIGHSGPAYALSKGGMVNLSRQIAFEYHLEGIRSNAICPDGVDTDFSKDADGNWAYNDPHYVKACQDHVCPGTPLCTADEVAQVALFLASDESEALNGQAIICDHGANL